MTANNAPTFAIIMLLTGIGIPILAALNGGLGGRLGSPMAASMILFGLAFLIATTGALATGSVGQIRFSSDIPFHFYFGGLFVAFYVIAVTFIAPKFGVGNAIFFVLVGQLISAAVIDHFALFGAARFPVDAKRFAGIALMIAGVWLARRTG
ncbi:MAG: DMT family transporter [Sphingopyxis sp.]|nr:DMT family transporter [Sphingopyxis sp.]